MSLFWKLDGPVSSVGIATAYGLVGPGNESRWGARFSTPVQTGPAAHPASCTMGTRSFPGVKSSWGVTLTPHYLLVPWWRKSRAIRLLLLWAVRSVQSLSACTVQLYLYSPQCLYSTAIPLLPLRAIRPVQSLSACRRVHFTFLPLQEFRMWQVSKKKARRIKWMC